MEITRESFKAYLEDIKLHADDEDMSGLKINISEAGMKIDVTFVDEKPKIMTREEIYFEWKIDGKTMGALKKMEEETHKLYKPLVDALTKYANDNAYVECGFSKSMLNLIIK